MVNENNENQFTATKHKFKIDADCTLLNEKWQLNLLSKE